MRTELTQIPFIGWALLAVILFSQSIWLFQDAQKRHANPWLWGLWGLIQCPTPLVVYLLVVRKGWSRIVAFCRKHFINKR